MSMATPVFLSLGNGIGWGMGVISVVEGWHAAWAVLLAPLFAAALISALALRTKKAAAVLSTGATFLALISTLVICASPADTVYAGATWFSVPALGGFPGLEVTIGFMTDGLSRLMLVVVTGVGLLIHLFAYGYIKEDPSTGRFFAKMAFFMFAMLGIVLANNLVMMFIFWELVGLASYMLIGFWFSKPSAAEASKKAFIVNRIGDFGFMLGILSVWGLFGTVSFVGLEQAVADHGYGAADWFAPVMALTAIGLFLGCVGKSAQFPLHVWLPDAMEGPTPVSALIHAATMVAAGVFMLCRVFFILELSPPALETIAVTGGITALMAALIAVQQSDIKRILAYSTLSQLGYMVMAVGLGGVVPAMFHLGTHAFFKALLFLGAGSIIHGLHHEQNIWKMGGLFSGMRLTSVTFVVGALALMGLPFLTSGFYSKEAILHTALHPEVVLPHELTGKLLFGVGVVTAALTAFYMTRLLCVAILGRERSDEVKRVHESPWIMTGPLIALAILSIVDGWLPIFPSYLQGLPGVLHAESPDWIVLGASVIALVVGVSGGWMLYRSTTEDPIHLVFLREKFFFDEFYQVFLVQSQDMVAKILGTLDRWVIGGMLVQGTAVCFSVGGEVLRLVQSGRLHAYVFCFVLGVILLLAWMVGVI